MSSSSALSGAAAVEVDGELSIVEFGAFMPVPTTRESIV
jgi:hypothetical protein